MPNTPIFAISGPTASGKTALGVTLAKAIGGEVINFDSVQIYKGIEIATAKPSVEEMAGVPHHLIDYVDPNVSYTAADWAADAEKKISEIESRSKLPVLVGGTGFYLRTLRRPLFESPKTDQRLRERLRRILDDSGPGELHRMLAEVDPTTADSLPVNDHARIIRALEVYHQTGKPISELKPLRPPPPEFATRFRLLVLDPDREELYAKINRRTEEHFDRGLVNEARALLNSGVSEQGNALGAHAYRRVCEYLRGERDLASAVERSKQDVRNYAKRQLTWFRREPEVVWFQGFGGDREIQARVIEFAEREILEFRNK